MGVSSCGNLPQLTSVTEKIPGLGTLIDKISDSVSVFIYTTIEVRIATEFPSCSSTFFVKPYLKPLLQNASTTLATGSAEVINNEDQFEVFHNPRAVSHTSTHVLVSLLIVSRF